MAMTTGSIQGGSSVRVSGTYPPQGTGTTLNNTVIGQTANAEFTTLAYGTGAGQVDLISDSCRTVTAAGSVTYDLYTGTDLKDLDGLTCAFRNVKFVQIMVVSGGDASGLAVGAAAADEWVGFFGGSGDTHTFFPGGPAYLAGSPAGVAVGASTKNLKIGNAGAVDAVVRITIGGTSA